MKTAALLRFLPVALGLALASTTHAQITVNSYDRGHYSSAGDHNPADTSYLAGDFGDFYYRSFFVFDLRQYAGDLTAATLRINNPFGSSPDALESVTLSSVGVSISTLLAGGNGTSIYNALDDSPNFISSTQRNPATTGFLEFSLNNSFRSYAEANFGDFIALAFRVTSIQPNSPDEFFFGNTSGSVASDVQLVLSGNILATNCPLPGEGNVAVPEPSTYGLIGAAALLAGIAYRRRLALRKA